MRSPFRALAALALVAACSAGQATVLTFGIPTSASGFASYGDRVTSFGTLYGSDGGATPNVVVDIVIDSGRLPAVYSSGYASLIDALGHNNFNEPGYLQLTPDAGFDVVLEGFDLGAWFASYRDSRIQVVDTAGTSYLDTGLFTFPANTVWHGPAQPIRSSLPLRIVVNDFGDLGLDNVAFSQVANVPEPGTWALLLAGLGVVGALARRRR